MAMNVTLVAAAAVVLGLLVRGQPMTALLVAAAAALSYAFFSPPTPATKRHTTTSAATGPTRCEKGPHAARVDFRGPGWEFRAGSTAASRLNRTSPAEPAEPAEQCAECRERREGFGRDTVCERAGCSGTFWLCARLQTFNQVLEVILCSSTLEPSRVAYHQMTTLLQTHPTFLFLLFVFHHFFLPSIDALARQVLAVVPSANLDIVRDELSMLAAATTTPKEFFGSPFLPSLSPARLPGRNPNIDAVVEKMRQKRIEPKTLFQQRKQALYEDCRQ